MRVIRPVTFDKATHLVAIDTSESSPVYASGTTYALADTVTYGDRIYESLQAGNTGHQPDLAASATWWLDTGPTNQTAMFDNKTSTASTKPDSLTAVVFVGQVNSLALVGLRGSSVTVTGNDGHLGTEVYNNTISLLDETISDWYEYFFEPVEQRESVVLTDIPPYGDLHLTIALTGSGTVQIGTCVWGTYYTIGTTTLGAKTGITDYSIKETDEYGNATLVQRAFSKRITASVFIENRYLSRVMRVLTDMRANPSVWVGSTHIHHSDSLVAFGYYKDFSIDISYPFYSMCSLEIEGLT